jgi:nucleoside-diphosphate-sugar epimerase
MKTLVIGGSGATGVPVLEGLLARGHDVTMLHRGVHEPTELPDVPHIHADPHFPEAVAEAVGDTTFDVVLAMYGRVAVIAEVFAGRCGQLVSIGAPPAYRGCLQPETVSPYGMALGAREDGPLSDEAEPVPRFAGLIRAAERAVFDRAAAGAFRGTVVRYPAIYGPRNLVPWEWSVMRRIQDGRSRMILPDNGLWIISRSAGRNAAEVVCKAVDNPDVANGQAYNAGDDDQFTVRQWAEAVAQIMGGELEFVGIPSELAGSALIELLPPGGGRPHVLLDINKAKRELGYRQVIGAGEAMVEAVEWLAAHPVTRDDYPLYPARFDYAAEDRLIEAYTQAVAWVHEQAPDQAPEAPHPMPHPKTAAVGRDERGR